MTVRVVMRFADGATDEAGRFDDLDAAALFAVRTADALGRDDRGEAVPQDVVVIADDQAVWIVRVTPGGLLR